MSSESISKDTTPHLSDASRFEIPNLDQATESRELNTTLAIQFVYGRTQVLEPQVATINAGDIVMLDEPKSSEIRIVADGNVVAIGALVEIDGQVGVQISRLLIGEEVAS